ncbi:DUF2993 domain-containing protein [Microbacterium sp. Kw_RZR3]|jgi:hypothetical protein|uniref:LmeA family phospholipid-binding protein n=1 Tax=unclassified Microbacterium TaxID=2609290 RepID=UPI0023DB7924|nr:DUF2993 domain-containing protein [Microbacterium sp. Kw_RZR3]MDF2045189.1 DUF2993 domain-containing protein [Microbacterium sp. Kw_RZR3]
MTDATARTPRKNGRWIAILIVVVVVVAGAAVAAEFIARSVVSNTVRSLVVEKIGLPDDQDVDVELGGVILPQLLTGRLDDVTITSDDVTLGPITGDVRAEMKGVPVSGGGAADGGTASIRLDEQQLRTLLAQIPDFPSGTVAMAAPDLTFTNELSVFGVGIPVGVSVTPGASNGDLTLTPTGFQLGGNSIDADTLRAQFGGVADVVLRSQSLCFADRLPAALTLTSATVQGQNLVASFDIDGEVLNDPALQRDGSCG